MFGRKYDWSNPSGPPSFVDRFKSAVAVVVSIAVLYLFFKLFLQVISGVADTLQRTF